MKKIALVLSLFAASNAVAAPAPMSLATARDFDALVQFSRCVVDRSPRLARAAIDSDFTDAGYKAKMDALVQGQRDCMTHGVLRMRGVVLAGAIAEALIKKDLAGVKMAEAGAPDAKLPTLQARDEGEMIGLCIARKAPGDAATLFDTAHGSDAERLALVPLIARLGPCTANGVQARFNKAGLRAIIALAYRRIAINASSSRVQGYAG